MLAGWQGGEKGQGFLEQSVYVRWYIGRQTRQKSCLSMIVCM
jgi:hypothetical protein